jgi:hypothetical protein
MFSIIIFIAIYFLAQINSSVDINGNVTGNYSFLFFINAFLGIIAAGMISQLNFKLNHFFTYLSQNTLLIIFLHYTFILVVFKIVPTHYMSDVLYFIFSIALLLIMYFPILFINKYLPFVVSPTLKKKN